MTVVVLNNCVRVLQTPLTTISTNTVHLRRHTHTHHARAREKLRCTYSGTNTYTGSHDPPTARSSAKTFACTYSETHIHTHTADKHRSAERLDQREGGNQFTCFTKKSSCTFLLSSQVLGALRSNFYQRTIPFLLMPFTREKECALISHPPHRINQLPIFAIFALQLVYLSSAVFFSATPCHPFTRTSRILGLPCDFVLASVD